jgi:hypothetical protein
MPREGYRVVTIPEEVHHRLAEAARSENRSVPKQIESMLNTQYPGLSALETVTCKSCGYTVTFTQKRNPPNTETNPKHPPHAATYTTPHKKIPRLQATRQNPAKPHQPPKPLTPHNQENPKPGNFFP